MNIKFKNPHKHTVQIVGPNRELIRVRGGQELILSDYFLKYSPKQLTVVSQTENNSNQLKRINELKDGKIISKKRAKLEYKKAPQNIRQKKEKIREKREKREKRQVVGKQSKNIKIEFSKYINSNQISISNDIGVGILSYNRTMYIYNRSK